MNTRVIWFPCRSTRGFTSSVCVHMRVCACVRASTHLQDDVRSGGLDWQRQHVSPHGLSVEAVAQVAAIGRDLQGAMASGRGGSDGEAG